MPTSSLTHYPDTSIVIETGNAVDLDMSPFKARSNFSSYERRGKGEGDSLMQASGDDSIPTEQSNAHPPNATVASCPTCLWELHDRPSGRESKTGPGPEHPSRVAKSIP